MTFHFNTNLPTPQVRDYWAAVRASRLGRAVRRGGPVLYPHCCRKQPSSPHHTQVREYWAAVRASRLGRAEGKQDDEIVGIATGYLVFTVVVLVLAVISNIAK